MAASIASSRLDLRGHGRIDRGDLYAAVRGFVIRWSDIRWRWAQMPSWRQVLISAALLALLIALFVLFFDLIEKNP
jgi:hypothetical protein